MSGLGAGVVDRRRVDDDEARAFALV